MPISPARALAALTCLVLASTPAGAAEGMWTFDNFPSAHMREEFGWAPDQAWLNRVMAATARMPTCSSANVSGAGLLLTNQHCVVDCMTALSTPDADYIANGFMARSRDQERRCPGLAIQVLIQITDVSAAIDAAAAGVAPAAFAAARDREIARLEQACSDGAVRCEVVTLYQGGRYALYRYKRYVDVRLVFAPEEAAAAFGGAADNFHFPRHCADFAFLRLYENNRPAATPAHLSMRFTPLGEHEIVLTAGNPGATSRLKTSAELAFERDVNLPWRIEVLSQERAELQAYAARGPRQARSAAIQLQGVDNSLEGLVGRHGVLADPAEFAHVTAAETDLQTRVRRNLAAARDAGNAWGEIAAAMRAYRGQFYAQQMLELRAAERSDLFVWARDIVRAPAERAKPEAQRLPRYSDARLEAMSRAVRAPRAVEPELEALHFRLWLNQLRQHLPANDPALARVLGAQSPEALAAQLAQSRLADPAYRAQLWDGGAAAVAASDDALIVFVRGWDGEARAARARYETNVERPVALASERIARARFRAFGDSRYPDATFSPRVSYGRVEGWNEPAGAVAPFTRMGELYARATGAAPLALSRAWLDARGRIDGQAIFNVAASTDVIGGSSGSPLLDRDGAVVGAVFDNNIHGIAGEYFYDSAANRSVTVASTAIRAALADVYHMDALLRELGGR